MDTCVNIRELGSYLVWSRAYVSDIIYDHRPGTPVIVEVNLDGHKWYYNCDTKCFDACIGMLEDVMEDMIHCFITGEESTGRSHLYDLGTCSDGTMAIAFAKRVNCQALHKTIFVHDLSEIDEFI